MSLPYGSASRHARGDVMMKGRVEGLPCAAVADWTSHASPQHMLPRKSYLQINQGLTFGNQSRSLKVMTFPANFKTPSM